MYDAQEKARRDYKWAIESSREEGEIKGEIKLIHTLQSILVIPQTPNEELSQLTLEQLQKLTAELQDKTQSR